MKLRTSEVPNVEAIMARIRTQVREQLQSEEAFDVKQTAPTSADLYKSSVSPVLYSEELNYLNANWHYSVSAQDVTSHRRIIGPIIVKLKRFLVDAVWNYLLKDYFECERKFNMHLVRFLNESSRYIDARDAEIFSQLIDKIDADILGVNERIDRIYDEALGSLNSVESGFVKRFEQLESDRDILVDVAAKTHNDLRELDNVIRELEKTTVSLFKKPTKTSDVRVSDSLAERIAVERVNGSEVNSIAGVEELLLYGRLKGSEVCVKEHLRNCVASFSNVHGVVIDLSCARGEFLSLLREAGIQSFGIDESEFMVARCCKDGLKAVCSDPIEYLQSLEDSSVAGVFTSQLIERLDRKTLTVLIELIGRKVRPGGKVVFETINPQSLTLLLSQSFNSLAHVWPVHQETLRFLMEIQGIKVDNVVSCSPVSEESKLRKVEISKHVPVRWKMLLNTLNNNVERLNDLMFGDEQYRIVATVENEVKVSLANSVPDSGSDLPKVLESLAEKTV